MYVCKYALTLHTIATLDDPCLEYRPVISHLLLTAGLVKKQHKRSAADCYGSNKK
jgi:hypothetical protein